MNVIQVIHYFTTMYKKSIMKESKTWFNIYPISVNLLNGGFSNVYFRSEILENVIDSCWPNTLQNTLTSIYFFIIYFDAIDCFNAKEFLQCYETSQSPTLYKTEKNTIFYFCILKRKIYYGILYITKWLTFLLGLCNQNKSKSW